MTIHIFKNGAFIWIVSRGNIFLNVERLHAYSLSRLAVKVNRKRIYFFEKALQSKQMSNIIPFFMYNCSYQCSRQHRDAARAHCCRPSFHVWGDLYMHLVITEAQCVTNEKFNETPSMDE